MTDQEWKPVRGTLDIPDEVYAALEPLDGFPKGTRGGPRPYRYKSWWIIISLSDFGDLLVGQFGPMKE